MRYLLSECLRELSNIKEIFWKLKGKKNNISDKMDIRQNISSKFSELKIRFLQLIENTSMWL